MDDHKTRVVSYVLNDVLTLASKLQGIEMQRASGHQHLRKHTIRPTHKAEPALTEKYLIEASIEAL